VQSLTRCYYRDINESFFSGRRCPWVLQILFELSRADILFHWFAVWSAVQSCEFGSTRLSSWTKWTYICNSSITDWADNIDGNRYKLVSQIRVFVNVLLFRIDLSRSRDSYVYNPLSTSLVQVVIRQSRSLKFSHECKPAANWCRRLMVPIRLSCLSCCCSMWSNVNHSITLNRVRCRFRVT